MKIAIVDDDRLVCASVQTILEADPEITVVWTGYSGEEACAHYREQQVDVLLMDIRMVGLTGLEAAGRILEEFPDARILFLTTFEDDSYIVQALRIGANGYIIKQDFESIAPAVKAVFAGQSVFGSSVASKLPGIIRREKTFDYKGYGLSEREYRVIELVAKGYSNREIAGALCLSEGTVRNYISAVLDKLELRDRTNLAVFYYQNMHRGDQS